MFLEDASTLMSQEDNILEVYFLMEDHMAKD